MLRVSQQERSHVELITVYEICRILGSSLDLQRSFRAALNVLTAHVGLERAMIVLADASKFGSSSGAIVCPLEEIDVLITDRGIAADQARAVEAAGVTLILAE